jgi:hypothetical protein
MERRCLRHNRDAGVTRDFCNPSQLLIGRPFGLVLELPWRESGRDGVDNLHDRFLPLPCRRLIAIRLWEQIRGQDSPLRIRVLGGYISVSRARLTSGQQLTKQFLLIDEGVTRGHEQMRR